MTGMSLNFQKKAEKRPSTASDQTDGGFEFRSFRDAWKMYFRGLAMTIKRGLFHQI